MIRTFGHENIIKLSKRPFDSVEAMNAALIDNINRAVGPKDRLFILGDLAYRNVEPAYRYLDQIICQNRFLIYGNHDGGLTDKDLSRFIRCDRAAEVHLVGGATKHLTTLFHYPCMTWNHSHRGSYQAYGHHHGGKAEDLTVLHMDVGVDAEARRRSILRGEPGTYLSSDYAPISAEEFCSLMSAKRHLNETIRGFTYGGPKKRDRE